MYFFFVFCKLAIKVQATRAHVRCQSRRLEKRKSKDHSSTTSGWVGVGWVRSYITPLEAIGTTWPTWFRGIFIEFIIGTLRPLKRFRIVRIIWNFHSRNRENRNYTISKSSQSKSTKLPTKYTVYKRNILSRNSTKYTKTSSLKGQIISY